jgi:hypothetical protein
MTQYSTEHSVQLWILKIIVAKSGTEYSAPALALDR